MVQIMTDVLGVLYIQYQYINHVRKKLTEKSTATQFAFYSS